METSEIVGLYLAGLSRDEIAARAGVSSRTVLRRLHAAGVRLRPRRPQPRPLCQRCKKRPATQLRGKHCATCWTPPPAPTPRTCELLDCAVVFTPPSSNRRQRYCSPEHWYASPEAAARTPPPPNRPKSLDELVRDGTFRACDNEELLEKEELDEASPDLLKGLQALFREATSRTERQALAQCFGRIARARAR